MNKPIVVNLTETASKYEAVIRKLGEYLDSHSDSNGDIRIDLTVKDERE